MTQIEIDVVAGEIRPVPVLATTADVVVLGAPARLCGWSLRDAAGDVPLTATGQTVAPGAGGSITSALSPGAGLYVAKWTVELEGPAVAADADNFRIQFTGGAAIPSLNPGAAGVFPQVDQEIQIPAGGSASIAAIAAGTAGVTYRATLQLTPSAVPDTVVEVQDGNMPLGEISFGGDVVDTRWFGIAGVHVAQQIKLHVISGVVTGTIYARFDRLTG